MSKKKKTLDVEIYKGDGGGHDPLTYKGRLLGLLSQGEFNKVLKDETVRSKLWTVETVPLEAIAERLEVENMRIALAIKKKDGKEVWQKRLFISEELDMLSIVTSPTDVTAVGKKGSYILLNEEEV